MVDRPSGVPYKFDDGARHRFLEELAYSGRIYLAAEAANVCGRTVYRLRQADEDFAELCQQALDRYRDKVAAEVRRRGIEGWLEPVYQQGQFVGYKMVYSDRMLELEAKRVDPSYRDRQQVDMNVTGGVMVVPGLDPNWEQNNPDSIPGECEVLEDEDTKLLPDSD